MLDFAGQLLGSHAPWSSHAASHASGSHVAPLNSTASGRTTSEWLRSHPSKRVCCVGYLWYPLNSAADSEYLKTVRMHDEARVSRNQLHVDTLLSLERQLIHLAETQSCLEETISHLKRQHQVLEKQARAPRVSVHTSETEFGIVSTTLSC